MYIEKNQYGSGPGGSICARCDLIIAPGQEATLEISDTRGSAQLEELKGSLYHPDCAKSLQGLVKAYNTLGRGLGY